jgi:ribosomal protein S3
MFYDEEAWQQFRGEALSLTRKRNEEVIEKWLAQIGYTEPVGYYRNSFKCEMEIYTTRPGVLIGKAGVSVHAFEKMLSEEFGGEWKVKLYEIRGGWANLGGKHEEAPNQ